MPGRDGRDEAAKAWRGGAIVRVTVDDGTALEVRETGSGPAFILAHGFGGAKEDFTDHLAALGSHSRAVTFDHRGHGESDAPTDPVAYSLERLAADTLSVADALGIDRFSLLGHSMGGMVAQRVVLAHPDRVDGLVLMDTAPGPIPGLDPDVLELGAQICREQGKDALKALLDELAPLETPSYRRLVRERPGYQAFCDAKWAALSGVMWATLVVEIAHNPDHLARLAAVTCPTLVIVGAEDEPFLAPAHALAATIPGAELVVVPGAGHSPQFENPTAWFAAVDGFVRAVGAGTADAPRPGAAVGR